jgi:hypothetical protein
LRKRERNDLAEYVKRADGLDRNSVLAIFEKNDFKTAIGILDKKIIDNTAADAAAAAVKGKAAAQAAAQEAPNPWNPWVRVPPDPWQLKYDNALETAKYQMKNFPKTWRSNLHTHLDTAEDYALDYANKAMEVFHTPVKSPSGQMAYDSIPN